MTTTDLTPEQLRVQCAERIGWTRPHMPQLPKCWQAPVGDTLAWSAQDGNPLPNYPVDARAALALVDRLAEDGWRCELNCGTGKGWECEFIRKARNGSKPDDCTMVDGFLMELHYAPADTLPLAICKAFLLAYAESASQQPE